MMERDKNLHRMLLKKEIPEPSDNLDDRIMSSVYKVSNKNTINKRYLYLAWIFFALGLVTGLVVSINWVDGNRVLFGSNILRNNMILQILFSFVILLLFERLYKLSIDLKKKYFDIESKTMIPNKS